MKKLLFAILSFWITSVFAQNEPDTTDIKFFFSLGTDIGNRYDNTVYFFQISGGFNIGDFVIEGFGKGMTSELTYKDDSISKNIDYSYAGLALNYTPLPEKIISPFGGIGIGVGNISLSDVENYNGATYVSRYKSDDITVFMFQTGADIRITKWLYATIAVKYEKIYGFYIEGVDINNDDFSGISGYGGIKFKL